ncbi:hypothetical protein [Streptomyces sp. JJ38]|uniref:hypothetical protein n=1 Tax=Streptomyces sp. JJ38 TaxID=2738128 RepID=UPI001C56D53F|nr:hypothetical protein [Streptomyces sp. JJ38]MBW1598368.1 hypothetical protein [Streptomyces sp. JJ38]
MTEAAATAPMTRAQKFQWYVEKGLAEGVRPLPEPMDETAVHRLVGALEKRFEILRTSIDVVDGALCQRLHDSGSPLSTVQMGSESDLPQHVARFVEDFRQHRHGRVGALLVQFRVLRTEGRQWLALVADNVAVDAGFHRVLDEETTRLLAGEPKSAAGLLGGADGIQPSAAAALETGPEGERERAEAEDYLRRHFATAPPRLHPTRPSSGRNEGRYYRSTLTLHGADHLFSRILSSTGLLPSTVVLAAFSQLMCWRSGTDALSVNVSMDNRHHGQLRRVLCATAQRVPMAFRLPGESLLTAASEVQRTLSEGYPVCGRYDPFDLIGELVRSQHRRGLCLSSDLAFNFVPPPQGWTALVESDERRDVVDDRGLAAEIVSAPTNETDYEYGASLSVRWTDGRTARLSVHGDSDVLAPVQCGALLRGLEFMLRCVGADRDCAVSEVAHHVGMHRREQCGHGAWSNGRWVDLAAVERRLLRMRDVEAAEVTLSPVGDTGTPGLVARVMTACGSPLSPLDLREELLRGVAEAEILVVPEWYEIVSGAADGEKQAHRRTSGDGRDIGPRPAVTDEERAVRSALEEARLVSEPDLDLCYVRAGASLARYPEFARRLRQRGYSPPGFAVVSGMNTLRELARGLRRPVTPA